MDNLLDRAKVNLRRNEAQKFVTKLQSDPKFAAKLRALVRTGNESKVAEFLKKNGMKLG